MGESFTYNDMNRLTGITLKRPSGQDLHCSVTYDALGRMTSREAVTEVNGIPQVSQVFSQPVFDATKVHALASAQTTPDMFPAEAQTITYTGFDKVSKIRQGNDSICYTYGYDRQRIRMEERVDGIFRMKDYVGMCEFVEETSPTSNVTQSLTYLTGPFGVFAVVVTENGVNMIHYILKDNLGSWTTITSGTGTVEQRLSYDAWGNLRDPDTWANCTSIDPNKKPLFDCGFTGHEHLYNFGLINMNGRMYDPVMSSFLSVDRYVQNPLTTQGFNRYAYCMNNPLRFVDPTGWLSGGGGGSGHGSPLPKVVVDGHASYILPEVTIRPDDPNLSDTYVYEEYEYTPNITSGGCNTGWGSTRGWSSGSHSGGSGGGNGNHGNNSSIKYMLLDCHQKYQHHTQTDIKGCKIATARSYYQYFSGKDLGESYFSTLVGGMIAVDKDTYLFEYYKACGLNVSDGMNVTIIEIGHQLEEGHPYSIVLKGEHTSNMDHVVTMVGIYKENADSSLKVFIKDPMQQNGQYYEWVEFREDIKDAYFITGLKKHQL
ncbi:MAG: RHS repeat-associated core domain-containing protein [Bacteroidales bacterium]|nr:RHS repeat-associated core domain-containing protein [Bacteroidales bacterium]